MFRRPVPRSKQYGASNPSAPRAQPVRVYDGRARLCMPVPKEYVKRSREYLFWVASQPCAHCGLGAPSQAAHADEGKGMALKSGDDTAFPLCADRPGTVGCHSLIGASGKWSRDERRALEIEYGSKTRAKAIADGAFPEDWT